MDTTDAMETQWTFQTQQTENTADTSVTEYTADTADTKEFNCLWTHFIPAMNPTIGIELAIQVCFLPRKQGQRIKVLSRTEVEGCL